MNRPMPSGVARDLAKALSAIRELDGAHNTNVSYGACGTSLYLELDEAYAFTITVTARQPAPVIHTKRPGVIH